MTGIRIWRHRKRGNRYVEIACATYSGEDVVEGAMLAVGADGLLRTASKCDTEIFELQASCPLRNGQETVLYMGEDMKLWVRPRLEFNDGRFALVSLSLEKEV